MPQSKQSEAKTSKVRESHDAIHEAAQEAWLAVDALRLVGGKPILRVSVDNRRRAHRHAIRAMKLLVSFIEKNTKALADAERMHNPRS